MSGLTSHRASRYVVTLLDRSELERWRLQGVEDGQIRLSAGSRLGASGSLSMRGAVQGIDWLNDRVRVEYEVEGGQVWPLGVFLLSSPKQSASDSGDSWEMELLGKPAVLDQDRVAQTYVVPEGARVVDAVVRLIESAGESRIALTDSPSVTVSEMVWEAGTSKLTIINELLESINYWALKANALGEFVIAPYTRPAQRPVAWRFAEGPQAIHLAEWEREHDLANVPNRVVMVGQGQDNKPAPVGEASNTDAKSPFSYASRGRWITHSETGVEAATQEILDALARRKLISLSTPQATLGIEHAPLPLSPNDLVEWDSQGLRARAILREVEYTLSPTALCKSKLVEVVDL